MLKQEMPVVKDTAISPPSIPSAFPADALSAILAREDRSLGQAPHRSRLASIVEAIPDFVALFDVEGKILYGNPAARQFLGLDADAPISSLHISDAHPAWANLLILGEGIQTALLDGLWKGEAALLNGEGEEIPVSEVILAHSRSDGRCEYLSLVAREVAEIKQAETALRESERFYRRIAETAEVGLWTIDLQNRITFANPKMAQLLGSTVDELVGCSIQSYLADSEQAEKTGSDGVNGERIFKLRRKDGAVIQATLSTSPLFDQNERFAGTVGVVRQVT
jgi:PAS domain S-box-containing protein